jgi:hypothetical protein
LTTARRVMGVLLIVDELELIDVWLGAPHSSV